MRPSRFVLIPLLAVLAVACSGSRGAGRAVDQVVLVTIDTLRADRVGCYGLTPSATPALDALALESVLFEDATSPAPITLVSHATMMTGLTPPAHGVRTNGTFRLPPQVETLAERLKARGFATAAFVGAFVLHHEFGLDQGFDVYDDRFPKNPRDRKFDFDERRAADVLSRAGDWVVAHRSSSFFLWAHLFDPHAPYDPPPPFDARFADRLYDGEVAYVDAELGKFFDRLRAAGILHRALLIVTADHGEGLGEHGEKSHGLFLYQSTLHVPLLVRPPGGFLAPRRVGETVGLVDLAPSILAAVRATGGAPMQGRVLPSFPVPPDGGESRPAGTARARQAIRDADPGSREQAGYYFENLLPFYAYGWAGLRGYREGRRKIVQSVGTELYALDADPSEAHDLARGEPRLASELGARMEEAERGAASLAAGGAENPDLSTEARERLLALGYAGASAIGKSPRWGTGPDPRTMLAFFDGIDRAKHLLAAGESQAGIALLQKLDADGPSCVAVLGLLGQAHMERGEIDAAMRVLRSARDLDPADYEIRRRLAEGHYAKGEYGAALAEAREALRLNGRNAESRSILGAALGRLGRHEEAVASFREAIAERPAEPALSYNLGLALESAGRTAEAEAAYAKAIELDPGNAPPRLALARILARRGDLAPARAQLEAAVGIDPGGVEAIEQLGIVLARSGDPEGALARFDRLVAIAPDRPEGHYDRGLVLAQLERRAEASAAFREFLSRWKGDPAKTRSAREQLRRLAN